ncbi:multicopper oxidase domain-containing protein [Rhodococcus oxybenzonivorans]|uniref:multicopper oxidase family protein n=1 Tax=Rhodococcus oxybenzonivorans TaxID=1990687 RepID=UPI0029547C91|nr:multicopper oxidase domain-containing protein [Rhodococcus oxybenzonivorans]MDV7356944.1 multicopper oxidase domain-containing protein [Rhodococcus oxybenzonivorans]
MVVRRRRPVVLVAVTMVTSLTLMFAGCASETATVGGGNSGPDGTPVAYQEPVKLTSDGGVLEVRLSARQGTVDLDTASAPVSNFLLFGYEVLRGKASDGSTEADGVYPAPTLRVDAGERLIIHYDNDLQNLTIEDFYDPAFTPAGGDVPIYPPALTSSPLNLHTHGLHVSPDGNADNVLLDIPAGKGNVYDYAVPKDMPNGLYWYHSHRHTVTAQQTYLGLAGLLEIGRPDGNLPLVTENDIPIRDMALQYNFVFDRKGGGHQLNDPNWPQYVSTLTPPEGDQLADGTYSPSLAPVNFSETSEGAQYFTNWYSGPLSPANHRGQNQFVPGNLQSFSSDTTNIPADPSLPDNQRDVQYTVNGQFQPELKLKPGQTEIWVLANISDFAYMPLRLTETATGNHPKFAVVGQDGNPFPQVERPVGGDGTRLVIPPASRYAIAVTMPQTGDLVLDMPPLDNAQPVSNPGVLYTNDGTENPPAVLGTVTVDPSVISYADGFFTFPTQKLIQATPDDGQGRTTPFEPGQKLDAYTSFVDTSAMTPDVKRTLTVSGGFGNEKASNSDPKAFTYEFDDNTFPNIPLIQPRLNSVEEWLITNLNNDEHPMHIHVNDFQVTEIVDPVAGTRTGVQMWGEDNVNVPAPVTDANENPLVPASVTLRTKFTEYIGTFVIHCHRLNHEDNGLMATVNVIPEMSTYAVAVPGSPGRAATVQVYDGNGDRLVSTATPFPSFEGTPTVAMADVDGDMVLDLVAGTGAGVAPEVVAYDGADEFLSELTRFAPFDSEFRGGVTVAGADIDGNALADNIIVGSGPGIESEVKIFGLPGEKGTAPGLFGRFTPYPGSTSGVTVATGMVDAVSGRDSIVTAPGPGEAPRVKTFRYDLYTPTAAAEASGSADEHAGHAAGPVTTSDFLAFDEGYTGGVSLSTGWVAGAEGGAQSIVTGMLGGDGTVRVWSSGSRLDGEPAMYLESPNHHSGPVTFTQIAAFVPFPGSGVQVATTSTTTGADLLVSGAGPGGAEVRKFGLGRADPQAGTLVPSPLGVLPPLPAPSGPVPLGGR